MLSNFYVCLFFYIEASKEKKNPTAISNAHNFLLLSPEHNIEKVKYTRKTDVDSLKLKLIAYAIKKKTKTGTSGCFNTQTCWPNH